MGKRAGPRVEVSLSYRAKRFGVTLPALPQELVQRREGFTVCLDRQNPGGDAVLLSLAGSPGCHSSCPQHGRCSRSIAVHRPGLGCGPRVRPQAQTLARGNFGTRVACAAGSPEPAEMGQKRVFQDQPGKSSGCGATAGGWSPCPSRGGRSIPTTQ